MSYIFLNNEIVHEDYAMVSVNDRGFLYGDGIFETLRSYDDYLFNIEKHIDRMRHSAADLKMPFKYSSDNIQSGIKELLKRNGLHNAYIRITLSRGIGIADCGLRIADCGFSSTFVIQAKPLRLYPADFYNRGISAIVSEFRRSASCPISRHKTSNFLTNIMARDEADLKGAHEAIILDTEGFVAECSASNIFFVEDGAVITPPLNVNILPGITRETVLDICKINLISAKEDQFGMERLRRADECFLTNSIMEIMPVAEINGVKIGRSVPGMRTKYLMCKYKELIKFPYENS